MVSTKPCRRTDSIHVVHYEKCQRVEHDIEVDETKPIPAVQDVEIRAVPLQRRIYETLTPSLEKFRLPSKTPSPLGRIGRAALDFGERSYSPAILAAAHTPDRGRVRRSPNVLGSSHHDRTRAPIRPTHRAAVAVVTG
jgi:hypothetical protein